MLVPPALRADWCSQSEAVRFFVVVVACFYLRF